MFLPRFSSRATVAVIASLSLILGSITIPRLISTVAAADSQQTVVVFVAPMDLALAADIVRPTGLGVVAFYYAATTRRGGYARASATSVDDAAAEYRALESDRSATGSIIGVRLAGLATAQTLASATSAIRSLVAVPSDVDVAVSQDPSTPVRVFARGTRTSRSSRGPGLALIGDNSWAPDHGRIDAANLPTEFFLFFIPINNGQMYHELTWASDADIQQFGEDAYEHDFKLFNDANGGPGQPACTGQGAYWVTRFFGVTWSTTLPADTQPYFDTNVSQSCSSMDFTVGMLRPKNLGAGVTYTITVRARRGTVDSSPLQLAGERIGKICDIALDGVTPWCVAGSHFPSVQFIARGEGVNAPVCRLWTRAPDIPSTPC